MDTGEERHHRAARGWIWLGLSAVAVLAAVWLAVPSPRGADGPHMTMPSTCSLLDAVAVRTVMSADVSGSGDHPGICEWKAANARSIRLQTELAAAGAGISAVDNAHRIFPFDAKAIGLAGLADEATERVHYDKSASQATVVMRAGNMLLHVSYNDGHAQPGYLAEIAEVLARQALRNAVGEVTDAGSSGRPASTRSIDEVVRGKHPLEAAEARYRPQPSQAVAPPSWRAGDDTTVMGFFDEFAFKVPKTARCELWSTHWHCEWALPKAIATISLSLRPCRPTCQDDWPFREVEWQAEDEATLVSTSTFDKLEIDDVTYRDVVQLSMKRTTPGYHLSVQVVVPEHHATTAKKIVNDLRFQAA